MHGLQPDVDLGFLIGKVIEQVAVGPHDVQINYESGGITFEYKCRLEHPTLGDSEWQGCPEDAGQLVALVSSRITSSGINSGTAAKRHTDASLF
jgi:hypothetical protein